MLHIFGCACWPNLRPYNKHKLQFRSKQCVFLGYSNLHKDFKCLDISSGRVYISRDVVFDENIYPFATLHPNVGARLRSEIFLLPEHLSASFPGRTLLISLYESCTKRRAGSVATSRALLGRPIERTDGPDRASAGYFA
jgi:hypothetical protein